MDTIGPIKSITIGNSSTFYKSRSTPEYTNHSSIIGLQIQTLVRNKLTDRADSYGCRGAYNMKYNRTFVYKYAGLGGDSDTTEPENICIDNNVRGERIWSCATIIYSSRHRRYCFALTRPHLSYAICSGSTNVPATRIFIISQMERCFVEKIHFCVFKPIGTGNNTQAAQLCTTTLIAQLNSNSRCFLCGIVQKYLQSESQ